MNQHTQRLDDQKVKCNTPSTPIPEVTPPRQPDTVPSRSELDTMIEGLMGGKGESDTDLNGDIDVTKAMFAFLALAGTPLSLSNMVTPENLQEAYDSAQSSQWQKRLLG
jgi:hypothetical protein